MVKALQETRDEAVLIEFKRELDLFGRVDHPNVAKLVGLCQDQHPHYMILQYTDWVSNYLSCRLLWCLILLNKSPAFIFKTFLWVFLDIQFYINWPARFCIFIIKKSSLITFIVWVLVNHPFVFTRQICF